MATWEYGALPYWTPKAAHARRLRGSASLVRTAAVGGLVLVLVGTSPYWIARVSPQTGQQVGHPQIAQSPLPGKPPTISSVRRAVPTRTAPPRRAQQMRPSARAGGFVVSFGNFSHRAPAEAHARTVRSKGYHASVAQVGGSFHVLSHAYHDRTSAEFWSKIYGSIGLQTRVLPLRAGTATQTVDVRPSRNL